jgi:hypothetical protein
VRKDQLLFSNTFHKRSIATSAGSLATLVGLATGYAMSGFIIGNDGTTSPEILGENFKWLFIAQGVALIVLSFPGLFFKARPPTAPGVNASDNGMTFLGEIKSCVRQRAFLTLLAVLGAGYGMFVGLWSTMQELVISTPLAAWVGIAFVGGGVVGAAIAGFIIDKWRIYQSVLSVGAAGALSSMVLFFFGIPSNEPWLIGSAVSAGFFIIALLPVSFETAVEVTFPVNEATSAGLLIMSGNIFAIIFVIAFSVAPSASTVLAAIIIFFAGTLLSMFSFKPKYRRLAHERTRIQD